jgi:hypothetical protein
MIVEKLVLVDRKVEFAKNMIVEKFVVVWYNIVMRLFVQVVDDEEEFVRELNELIEWYRQFLVGPLVVVM